MNREKEQTWTLFFRPVWGCGEFINRERKAIIMKKTAIIAAAALVLAAALLLGACGAKPPVQTGAGAAQEHTLPVNEMDFSVWGYSADRYDQRLAQRAARYAVLAYDDCAYDRANDSYYNTDVRDDPPVPERLHAQLSRDGYQSVQSENYGNEEEHDISYTLAHQHTNTGEALLAVVLRGTDGVEWLGNMDVGFDTRHESFEKANRALQAGVSAYIEEHRLESIIFFVTGHSRGAAVANLFAADLNRNSAAFESEAGSVFCYAFATPNHTTAPAGDKNIFNFCFDDDFVPQVPLARWGYGKYGTTFTASAQALYGTNSGFRELVDTYVKLSNRRAPSFDQAATEKVLDDFYSLAPSVDIYYTKKYTMSPDHGLISQEADQTMHEFMRNYIGNAAAKGLADLGASLGSALKRLPAGNDVKAVADYFIEGWLPPHSRHSINDTHQAFTYYAALKTGCFAVPAADPRQ